MSDLSVKIPTSRTITFGYKTPLSKLWKAGKLPTVTHGFYKQPLSLNPKSRNFVTNEHVQPHSKGGPTDLKNIVLAAMGANNDRGNKPLSTVFTKEGAEKYYDEFKDVVVKYKEGGVTKTFNGNDYVKGIKKTVHDELKKEGRLDLLG